MSVLYTCKGTSELAQQVCDELGVLASSVIGVDMELKTEASLRHARTLLAANQFGQGDRENSLDVLHEQVSIYCENVHCVAIWDAWTSIQGAAAVAHSLFCMCYKFNLQVENATVLLLLAEIHKKSGNAVLGLPYALASLSFCQSFNLDLLKASATLTLAELWLSLGSNHVERASILVQGALPMILGHGGLELHARAYIAEAKCYLSNPSFSGYRSLAGSHPEVNMSHAGVAIWGLSVLRASLVYSVSLVRIATSWYPVLTYGAKMDGSLISLLQYVYHLQCVFPVMLNCAMSSTGPNRNQMLRLFIATRFPPTKVKFSKIVNNLQVLCPWTVHEWTHYTGRITTIWMNRNLT
ncbi:Anaphase-promoting complex subunit 5 [Vitis vinifera]|uniref:Anaphase-promoting complex subunit 5 n=1 Tax=Vitis vinifera TaxID=29760 RepID=A0A438GPP6_VITVI|nr:Anaphase-promoting complex subunit 5 [Vitis vinifera]